MVGGLNGRGDLKILFGEHRLVMQGDHGSQRVRQVPLFGNPLADQGMADAEGRFFGFPDRDAGRARKFDGNGVLIGEILIQKQLADVVQQAPDKDFLHRFGVDPLAPGDHARRDGDRQRMRPEIGAVQRGFLAARVKRIEHAQRGRQVTHGVEPQNDDCVGDGGNLAGEAVIG